MKTTWIIITVVAVLLCAALMGGHLNAQDRPAAAARYPVAVCNVVQILNNYQKGQDLKVKLNDQLKETNAESEKRSQAIEEIRKELRGLKVGSKEYEDRFREIQRLTINHAAWLEYKNSATERYYCRLTKEMYAEVRKTIAVVAKRRGFGVVLYIQRDPLATNKMRELLGEISQRKILYSDPSVDITDEVLSALNEAHRAGPG
ncbi:MAG: OmpH family outer membrane protein [Phycisphaerae bacterium]|jgi:Skp family chaperone for outer membrane proteins|nr:OmpH family outer membrane protein [Phycisphaerae bacterium]MDP7636106.1 OmpH family outer membrane protein [Phycisphaerae bacterium]